MTAGPRTAAFPPGAHRRRDRVRADHPGRCRVARARAAAHHRGRSRMARRRRAGGAAQFSSGRTTRCPRRAGRSSRRCAIGSPRYPESRTSPSRAPRCQCATFSASTTFVVEGRTDPVLAYNERVTPQYFDTLQVPLRRGRLFTADDRFGRTPVMVINESDGSRAVAGRGSDRQAHREPGTEPELARGRRRRRRRHVPVVRRVLERRHRRSRSISRWRRREPVSSTSCFAPTESPMPSRPNCAASSRRSIATFRCMAW